MITPFINFGGRCSEAIAFYEKALGGQDKRIMYYVRLGKDKFGIGWQIICQ